MKSIQSSRDNNCKAKSAKLSLALHAVEDTFGITKFGLYVFMTLIEGWQSEEHLLWSVAVCIISSDKGLALTLCAHHVSIDTEDPIDRIDTKL